MQNIQEGKFFLEKELLGFVGKDGVDTVVEYLCTFDTRSGIDEILLYLEELCGKSHAASFKSIVTRYSKIIAGEGQGNVQIPRQATRSIHQDNNAKKSSNSIKENAPKLDSQPFSVAKTKESPATNQAIVTISDKTSKPQPKINSSQPVTGMKNKKGHDLNKSIAKVLKDTISCKCMATNHNYYSSCSNCGKIICDNQSPEHCDNCGSYVYPPMSAEDAMANGVDPATVNAYKQKDKLLQFDKENAKRTQVHDAQGDYYQSSSAWLSAEERADMEEKEVERKKALKKDFRVAKISIDLQDRRVVEYRNDDDEPSGNSRPEQSRQRVVGPAQDAPANTSEHVFSGGDDRQGGESDISNKELLASTNRRMGAVYRDLVNSYESQRKDGARNGTEKGHSGPAQLVDVRSSGGQGGVSGVRYGSISLGRVQVEGDDDAAAPATDDETLSCRLNDSMKLSKPTIVPGNSSSKKNNDRNRTSSRGVSNDSKKR